MKRFLIPILRKYNTIRGLIRSLVYFRKSALRYNLLEKGTYCLLEGDKIVITDVAFSNQFDLYKSSRFGTLILKLLLWKRYNSDNSVYDTYRGQAAMITINNTIKVFDFKDNTIFTMLSSEDRQKMEIIKSYFCDYLPLPYLYSTELGVVEMFVRNSSVRTFRTAERMAVFSRIIDDQLSLLFFKGYSGVKDAREELLRIENYGMQGLNQIASLCLEKSAPFVIMKTSFLHCDVHFGNVLYTNSIDRLYYIDFEYARDEICIYDIVNCVYVEYIEHADKDVLEQFIYNDKIYKLLSSFGSSNVDRYSVVQLVYRFLISRISFDLENAARRFRGKTFQKYCSVIEKKYSRFIEKLVEYEHNAL